MNSRVAHRYAQALVDIGEEHKTLEKISEDLQMIELTMLNSKDLLAAMNSPVIKPDAKLRILKEIFGKRLHAEVSQLMILLVSKGRAGELFTTAQEFRKMLDIRHNITHAQIASAVGMSEEERLTLQAKLERITGKRIKPTFTIDPSLKGGFTARIDDTLVDASLKHQLELLSEQFKHGGSPILN